MADQKWAADERKLAQAYEDVSYGRYKVAQNALDRHLKKSPKSQPALILRMVLLEKTGADDKDVLKAFEAVKATGELSGRGAWWVGNTLRALQRLDLTLNLYAEFWDAHPDRMDYGEQTFLHAVAAWDTAVMCSSSRKMFNKMRAPTWGRVAAWAEYVSKLPVPADSSSPDPEAPTKDFQIAKLLLSTSGSDNSTSDIYWLRTRILLAAGDAAGALQVAQEHGKVGSLNRLWYRMTVMPEILVKLDAERREEGWKVEWDWVVGKLKNDSECQRNYAFYKYLLRIVNYLGGDKAKEAADLLRSLDESIGTRERAPKLALLQLDNEVEDGLKMAVGDWDALVAAYWTRWGSKVSVITELEGVAAGEEGKRTRLDTLLGEKRQVTPTDVASYREVLHAEQMLLRTKPGDWVPQDEDIKRIWKLYLAALPYGVNLPETDIQPADQAAYVVVHLLALQWSSNKSDETPLFRAVSVLRYVIEKSPSATHAKYILVRLARLSGAPSLISDKHFGASGLQEVQLDTLLHPLVERASVEAYAKGLFPGWSAELDKAEKVYHRTASDLPEHLKHAIQGESYTRIPSLYTFNQKFAKSIPGASTRLEKARYQLLDGQVPSSREIARLKADYEAAKVGGLHETRDWEMFTSIGGDLPSLDEVLVLENRLGEAWLRSWGGVVQGLIAFVHGSSFVPQSEEVEGLSEVEKVVVEDWRKILRRLDQVTKPAVADEAQAPIDGAFQVSLATSPSAPSRWARLYPVLLVVEVMKHLDLVIKRLDVMAQPTGTGKAKKKADPRLIELLSGIRKAKQDLKAKAHDVVESLAGLEEGDRAIQWNSIAAGYIEDADFVAKTGKEVVEARVGLVKNIQATLSGKK